MKKSFYDDPTYRKKLSEKAKLRGNNGNTLKKQTEQGKIKIGLAAKNASKETREKQRLASLGRNHSDISKKKMSLARSNFLSSLSSEEKVKKLRNWIEAGARSSNFRNTKPELYFEELLKNKSINYRKQKWIAGSLVDFFLLDYNLIVEIQGCWWHGCEKCGYNQEKHIKKRESDLNRKRKLESLGYQVKFVWEHELR